MQADLQRLELVLEGARLGSWDWWLKTDEVVFDSRWCRMLGLDPATTPMTLSTWENLVHPDDLPAAYQDIETYLQGKTPFYENTHRMRHADGHWLWILDRGRISEYGPDRKPVRFTGCHFEITESKELQALSESIQKMAKIGGWELEVATSTGRWTDETYRIHGLPPGATVNAEIGIGFYAPRDRETIGRHLEQCIQGVPYTATFEIKDAQGRLKWVRTTGEPLRDSQGTITRLRGTFQDITEQKLTEDLLQEERSKSIHASKLASLGEMSAGLAHEINNPLAVVLGNLELLGRSADNPEKFATRLESTVKAAKRIETIVGGLKRFSRRSDGIPPVLARLADIIDDAVVLTGARAKRNDCHVAVHCPLDLYLVCEAVEIEQVLVNLLNNAFDAIANLPTRDVYLSALKSGDQIVLKVLDSGPGISDEVEQKLFQPFFTTKPPGEGTGLGLSISRDILARHGATLALNREQAQTCFEIRFAATP
ncbi:MAG: PAS domain-containing protein [Spirochaetales bacterium]